MNRPLPEHDKAWRIGLAPGSLPLLGHGLALYRQPLAFLNSLSVYGDLVELRLGPRRAWMVCHPELAHQVLMDTGTFDKGGPLYDRLGALMGNGLVTCRQNTHRDKRRLLQPAFRPSYVPSYANLIAGETEAVCSGWADGRTVPVTESMMTLTTRVISHVLFSDSLDKERIAEVRDCLTTIVRGLFVRTIVPVSGLFRLPIPPNRRYQYSLSRLHSIINAVIENRAKGTDHNDVLGTLLQASIKAKDVHDHLITLLLTGVEAPALCLSDAFSLLARHPEAEQRLHRELNAVLPGGRLPRQEDLPHLIYTRCVITETLRHSSPGWLFTRLTTKETELAGHKLPRGATVLYSPYLLHHDSSSFPQPDHFLPDRWLAGESTIGERHAFVPFSAGNRKCLGDEFSMVQATLALATVAARWRLRCLPEEAKSKVRPAITLGQRELVMTCQSRIETGTGHAVAEYRASRVTGESDAGHA